MRSGQVPGPLSPEAVVARHDAVARLHLPPALLRQGCKPAVDQQLQNKYIKLYHT